jgi:hypothetical protein
VELRFDLSPALVEDGAAEEQQIERSVGGGRGALADRPQLGIEGLEQGPGRGHGHAVANPPEAARERLEERGAEEDRCE